MSDINHVAIIMDGNGRWGLKNLILENLVIKKALLQLKKNLKLQLKKIKFLTLYTFSTEN